MRYRMQVLETATRLSTYEVEADSDDAALEAVRDGDGKVIDNEMWEVSDTSIESDPEEVT